MQFVPGSDEGLCEAEEGAHDEEKDVDDGDGGGQQLHHDGPGIGVIQTLNVQVLLLGGLLRLKQHLSIVYMVLVLNQAKNIDKRRSQNIWQPCNKSDIIWQPLFNK